ncbi:Cinnamoyl-CoA reductase-like SNL6, partial [Linum perenne]
FHLLTTLQKLNAFPPFSPFFKFPNKFSLLFFDRKQLTSSDLQSIPLPHMAPYVADHDHDQDQAQTVCVMDASGNLGSALVESLLLRGYSVHAAVQLHGKLEGSFSSNSSSRLRVFEMDMFDYHAITEALRGCSALFYSFEPPSDHPDYDESMAEVEVMAAHNALEACAQTPTVHKVVFTSSATAVIWKEDRSSSSSSAAADGSKLTLCFGSPQLWHALSKTLSEKAAWALAMDRDINMVAVNGGLLLPSDHHHNHLSLSHPYLKGAAEMYDDGVLVTVDLDFLVEAHIRVFEDSSSFGRYLCFDRVVNSHDEVSRLARRFSSSPPAGEVAEEREVEQRISNRKLCEHMVGFENGLKVH